MKNIKKQVSLSNHKIMKRLAGKRQDRYFFVFFSSILARKLSGRQLTDVFARL